MHIYINILNNEQRDRFDNIRISNGTCEDGGWFVWVKSIVRSFLLLMRLMNGIAIVTYQRVAEIS